MISFLYNLKLFADSLESDSDEDLRCSQPHVKTIILADSADSEVEECASLTSNSASIVARQLRVRVKNYVAVIQNYPDEDFLSHFRVSRMLAYGLINEFRDTEIYKVLEDSAGKEPVTAESHILLFLWFAGHQSSSYRDDADRFDVSLSTMYEIISRVIDFLLAKSPTIIRLPNNEEKLATDIYYRQRYNFPGIIGALDGSHVKIDCPSEDQESYFNQKHYHSMQLQGLVNHKKKFIHVFIGYPGSVHDPRVFNESDLPEKLQNICNDGSYILVDSAYPLRPYMMVPYWDNGHLTLSQRRFNKRLGQCRITVEHTFGLLKQRFRQLYFCKLKKTYRIATFIHACCVLHNMANVDDFHGELHEPEEDMVVEEVEIFRMEETGNEIRDNLAQQF